jgi:hypothetical protein
MGEWVYDQYILDLVTEWRQVVRFTLWPLYPGERTPRTHWIGSQVGLRTGMDGVEKFLNLPGLELRPLGPPARSQSLCTLRYPVFNM